MSPPPCHACCSLVPCITLRERYSWPSTSTSRPSCARPRRTFSAPYRRRRRRLCAILASPRRGAARSPAPRGVAHQPRHGDAIDVAAATALGIAVVNNPGLGMCRFQNTPWRSCSTSPSRRILPNFTTRAGWTQQAQYARLELHGRLALIGLGHIGSEVARKCIAAFSACWRTTLRPDAQGNGSGRCGWSTSTRYSRRAYSPP